MRREECLQNGLILPQSQGAFPLGTDAMVLADFARVEPGAAVCDLCAGSGAVGLLLLAREPRLTVTAVELQEAACRLMDRAVAENRLEDRFQVLRGDLREIKTLLRPGSFRHVVCNPPYFPLGRGALPREEAQAIARTELCCTLEEVCDAARWLLPTAGSLWLVHRPERAGEVLSALRGRDLEPKRLRAVCPRPETPPSLFLVQATRGAKPGLVWEAPLLLAKADGSPTEAYRRIYHL